MKTKVKLLGASTCVMYVKPEIDVLDVSVEQGFAYSVEPVFGETGDPGSGVGENSGGDY